MQQRLDHIHGLRGIAALVVVLQHACQHVQDAGVGLYRPLLDTINLGRFGVVLFFLISGLVVPFSFRGTTPLRHFAISRLFRLYPAYWLSLPVLYLVAVWQGAVIPPATLLANLTMIQTLLGYRNVGPGYWTLTYEVVFYALCALLFGLRLLDRVALNGVVVLTALVLAGSPVAMALVTGEVQPITNAPFFIATFFLGMLLRRAFVDRCPSARIWSALLAPLTVLVGIGLSGWIVPAAENANPYLRPLMLSLGMALPVPVFVAVLWLRPRVPAPVLALGTISYALYLFQDVGLYLMRGWLPPGEWPLAYVLAVLVVSLAIAVLVHRRVEVPMIALGRRVAERLEGRTAVAATR